MLGSGAVIVMDESACMVKALERLSASPSRSPAGNVRPCHAKEPVGCTVVHRIKTASAALMTLDLLNSVTAVSWGAPSLCAR